MKFEKLKKYKADLILIFLTFAFFIINYSFASHDTYVSKPQNKQNHKSRILQNNLNVNK